MDKLGTVFENFNCSLIVDDKQVNLSLWDNSGSSDYARLRELSYPTTDVFVITFSTLCVELFDNVEKYWVPEIRALLPDRPIILAGNDVLVRNGKENERVPDEKIAAVCKKCKLKSYHNVSPLTWHGIRDLFDDIIFTGLHKEGNLPVKNEKCEIM